MAAETQKWTEASDSDVSSRARALLVGQLCSHITLITMQRSHDQMTHFISVIPLIIKHFQINNG